MSFLHVYRSIKLTPLLSLSPNTPTVQEHTAGLSLCESEHANSETTDSHTQEWQKR